MIDVNELQLQFSKDLNCKEELHVKEIKNKKNAKLFVTPDKQNAV